MMILSGKKLSEQLTPPLLERCRINKTLYGRSPSLHVLIIGDDPASHIYVKMKARRANEIGMTSQIHYFDTHTSQDAVMQRIHQLNKDPDVDGILVQLPLPFNFSKPEVLNAIQPSKDVDGLTSSNLGMLFQNSPKHAPCTPLGCMQLLETWKQDISGLNAVVIGRSNLVGSPISMMLTKANATVTLCHSHTADLKQHTKLADILIVACGHPQMIDDTFIRDGACVIDVGITKKENILLGDVNFEAVKNKVSAITPVPGGVGPMTVYNLLNNTQNAMDMHFKRLTS